VKTHMRRIRALDYKLLEASLSVGSPAAAHRPSKHAKGKAKRKRKRK
jgi:hypothetical protein